MCGRVDEAIGSASMLAVVATVVLLGPYCAAGSGGIMDDERLLQVSSSHPDRQIGAWHRGQRKRVPFETSCYYTHEPELKYGCLYSKKHDPAWEEDSLRREERQVLRDLWAVTNGQDWRAKDNWANDADPCWDSWYGVTCDEHGHVIALELSDNKLVGTLPTNLGRLTALLKLDVSTTAPSYHSHTNQYANRLTGALPSLKDAKRLEEIEISGNAFTSLPSDLWLNGGTLRTLSASHNLLTSLPMNLLRFTALHTLELGHNSINVAFPEDFGYLTNARFVQFEYNWFHGTIPSNIVGMNRLRVLDMSHNPAITGELPVDILTEWSEIDYLSIYNTSVSGYISGLCIDIPFCWNFMFDTHADLSWGTAADVPDIVEATIQLALGGR